MHFLEAYCIVHDYAGAVGTERKSMLIPYSSVKHSTQELLDAFVIFFGHMVLWNTRTKEQYEQYLTILHSIYFIVPDETFRLIEANAEILEKAEKSTIFRMMNKKAVETAETSRIVEAQLLSDASEKYFNHIKQIDFGAVVIAFQDLKQQYIKTPEVDREDFGIFMDEYIEKVYSYTSYKKPCKEDYSCFWRFEYMRELLEDFDSLSPVAKKVYLQYKGLIMNSK